MKITAQYVKTILFVCLAVCLEEIVAREELHKGYIIYCPCMGRFGNQAEQLLGSLLFAKSLNRTLVLPPFIHYEGVEPPELVPFDHVLKVNKLALYHDVITLEAFLKDLSSSVWPKGDRNLFCYGPRSLTPQKNHCDGLSGEPYSTFWRHMQISNTKSIFYRPLKTLPEYADQWNDNYSVSKYPVLAFIGAPSTFPAHRESISIQRYVEFSEQISGMVSELKLRHNISSSAKYLSIHLRHGSDWKRACRHLLDGDGLTQLFSSNQCTGYNQPSDLKLSYETCLPSRSHVVDKLKNILAKLKESFGHEIKTIHIATDKDDSDLWSWLSSELPGLKFVKVSQEPGIYQILIDLFLMTHSDSFIGNCVSSFSAFAARIRKEQLGKSNSTFYFGQNFGSRLDETKSYNDEL